MLVVSERSESNHCPASIRRLRKLPSQDSNLDNEIQILGCYHYTTGQSILDNRRARSQRRYDENLRETLIEPVFDRLGLRPAGRQGENRRTAAGKTDTGSPGVGQFLF